jgi:hypothetical protein
VRGNEVHGNEPLLQGQFGVLEYRACGAREVVLALVATETSVSTSDTMVLSAMWAYDITTPTCLCESLLADILAAEIGYYCDN